MANRWASVNNRCPVPVATMRLMLSNTTGTILVSPSSHMSTCLAGRMTPCPVVAVPSPVSNDSSLMVSMTVVVTPPACGSSSARANSFKPSRTAS
jgi:hypothetical protein